MATYYVRTDGSDASAGTANTAAGAWRTIGHAASNVSAGDTVLVGDGTYNENISITAAGTSSARITFKAINKRQAKIVGSSTVVLNIGSDPAPGNPATNCYVDIIGFDVSGDSVNSWLGILARGSNVRIYDCYVHDLPATGAISGGNGGAGIDVTNGDSGASGAVIERNLVERVGAGFNQLVHGIYLAQLNVICRNNRSNNNSGWGIHSYHTTDALTVCNNVCFSNGAGGILIANNGAGSPATVRNSKCNNNICIDNAGYSSSVYGISEQNGSSTNVYQNNCCYNNQNGNFSIPTGTAPTGTITASAQFVNYQTNGTGDYHLQSSSPCIDAGTSNGAPSDDYAGSIRPQGTTYDIGIYEFGGTTDPNTQTTTKLFTFTSNDEGWADNGSSAAITFAWFASDGSPTSGCLRATAATANLAGDYEYAVKLTSLDTWETWGVPAGATVTGVQVTSFRTKVAAFTNGTSHSVTLNLDTTSGATLGNLVPSLALPTSTSSTWTTQAAGPVFSLSQPSNSPVSVELKYILSTGASTPSIDTRFDSVTLEISYVPLTYQIWPTNPTPVTIDSADTVAVELGVKFKSDLPGYISAIRFYKASTNTGTHVGALWTTSGTLLGSVTFTGETASGWQQMAFTTPIPIAANTLYIASYHAPNSHWSYDPNYFASSGQDAAPLHAPSSPTSGSAPVAGNGVYLYTATPAFPIHSIADSNYWVDVLFLPDDTPRLLPSLPSAGSRKLRAAATAYMIAVSPVPVDSVAPVPVARISDRIMARRSASTSYNAPVSTTPRDAGTRPTSFYLPDRAPAPRLPLANQGYFHTGPVDAGLLQPIVGRAAPDRAFSAQRAANAAYLCQIAHPADPGLAPVTPEYADSARGYGPQTFALLVAPVVDETGFVGAKGGRIKGSYLYRGLPQIASYAITVTAPPDAGILAIPPETPDLARGAASRPESFVLMLGTPNDLGTLPTSVYLPERAPAPRLPLANYGCFDTGPVDAGVSQPVVGPATPDRAATAPRAASTAYSLLTSTALLDAGTLPTSIYLPDQAPGPRSAARSVYVGLVASAPLESQARWPAVDVFTDTSGSDLVLHLPDSGGMWVRNPAPSSAGQFAVSNANRLRYAGSGARVLAFNSEVPPSADYDIAADLTCFTNPDQEAVGVAGRMQNSGAEVTAYVARYRAGVGFQIMAHQGGTAPQLGSTYARVLSAGETARVTLRMAGTSISLLVDGVLQIGPITDSTITDAGFAGVYGVSSTADTDSTGIHLDNWNAQFSDPPLPASMPERARRAVPSFIPMSTAAPLDVISPVNINPLLAAPNPNRGPAYRAAISSLSTDTPSDAGTQPPPVFVTGLAPGRTNRAAYALIAPTPGDQGIILVSPALASAYPHRTWGVFRQAALAPSGTPPPSDAGTLPPPLFVTGRAPGASNRAALELIVLSPRDAGIVFVSPSLAAAYPDRTWGVFRQAALAPTGTPPPPDAGTQSTPLSVTARAPGTSNRAALELIVLSPRDAGIVFVSPSLAPSMPDRVPPRLAQIYYSLVTPPPHDAGVLPGPPTTPDLARTASPRPASFTLLVGTPPDAGVLPTPTGMPDRTGPRLPRANYATQTPSPRDAGQVPAWLSVPDRAAGPTRAANAAYQSRLFATPPDQGIPFTAFLELGHVDPGKTTQLVLTSAIHRFNADYTEAIDLATDFTGLDAERTTHIDISTDAFDIDPDQTTFLP